MATFIQHSANSRQRYALRRMSPDRELAERAALTQPESDTGRHCLPCRQTAEGPMPDNTLSTEERDFIRSVFSAPPSNGGATTPLRPDTGSTLSQSLLARLSEQATLSLHAQLDDCRVIFPLQMVKDAEHGPHLKLGTPSLLEDGLLARGSITRLWRLDLEKPLESLTRYGSNSGMQVEQLAPGGLVLASPDTTH